MRCTLKSSALRQASTADAFREGGDEEMGKGGKEEKERKYGQTSCVEVRK